MAVQLGGFPSEPIKSLHRGQWTATEGDGNSTGPDWASCHGLKGISSVSLVFSYPDPLLSHRLCQSLQQRGSRTGVHHPNCAWHCIPRAIAWHAGDTAGFKSQGWLPTLFIPVLTFTNISRSCSRGRIEQGIHCLIRSIPSLYRSSSGEPGHTIPAIHGCLFYHIHKNSAKVNAALRSTWVLKPMLSQLCHS